MVTWLELVDEATARLAVDGNDVGLSVRWMAQEVTGADAGEWVEVQGQPATQRHVAKFDAMIERYAAGEPLQYVLGSWGFRSLELFVDSRVLIPRPETEVVAGLARIEVERHVGVHGAAIVADLGTGSGAIGLALAAECPQAQVWLTDASREALAVARANLVGLGRAGTSVRVAEGSWFDALPNDLRSELSVIVSNPPYVADRADLEKQVAEWEPLTALVAPQAGTAHLRHLIDEAPGWLRPGGALVLEMAPDQVEAMADLARTSFLQVETAQDMAGRDRAVVARL